ncbi:hypothetical protein BU15DRAFT_83237 [Melanogaster broomeanus]|nr:hypothetical protein BU15DRAFT_83237 [Melanogaster broomeanus]
MSKGSSRTPKKTLPVSASKPTPHKATKANKENLRATNDSKKARAVVLWAKPENFHLTDTLLTLIEESVTWKGALGFDKGAVNDPTPTGKGKSFIQHWEDIAEAFFLDCNADANINFTKGDLPLLKTVIKNQINSLKSTFAEYHNKLGETGHGLVTSGRSDELYEGSEAANVYDAIKKKFPWYLRMNDLMGGSPISSRKAVTNSQSILDLSVLGAKDDNNDDEDDGDVCLNGSGPLSPCSNLPFSKFEEDFEEENVLPKLKLALPSKRVAESPVISHASKKRNTPQDLVREVADADRKARLIMNETNAKERTAREQIKCQTAYDTAIAVEQLRIKAQAEQAAAQREHDILMMERQIELARLHARYPTGATIDPQLQG